MINDNLAILVQPENQYDTLKLVARVLYLDDKDGKLLNPSWNYGDRSAEVFDGFEVSAYLGSLSYSSGDLTTAAWGFSYTFKPYQVQRAAHATAIARTFTKLDKGMDAIRDAEGYLTDRDFHVYVLRVARVLKIKSFYVRSTPQQFGYTGEHYRKVDGSGLQSYIEHTVALVQDGKKAQVLAELR